MGNDRSVIKNFVKYYAQVLVLQSWNQKMLEFLIDNIYVVVGGQDFQQSIGIPMGTNYAPLLADLFLYIWGGNHSKASKWEKNLLLWPSKFDILIYRRHFIYLKQLIPFICRLDSS
jgi:hypothetical protein